MEHNSNKGKNDSSHYYTARSFLPGTYFYGMGEWEMEDWVDLLMTQE
jgi:hypothetical protein